MGKSQFRNMRSLYRYQVIIVFLLFSFYSFGQKGSAKNYNYLDYQQKPYYFGITLGINNSSFIINHSKSFILNDSIAINTASAKPGLTFQGIANLKIGSYFDFRMLAGFSLSERNLSYYRPGEENPYKSDPIDLVYIDVPMLIRYKSSPYKDKRLFVIAGIKYSYDVNGYSRSRQADDLVTISSHDFSAEIGAGMQMFFPYFIFSPELKLSHGIGNVLFYNNNLNESRVIDRLLSRTFTISLHFEG